MYDTGDLIKGVGVAEVFGNKKVFDGTLDFSTTVDSADWTTIEPDDFLSDSFLVGHLEREFQHIKVYVDGHSTNGNFEVRFAVLQDTPAVQDYYDVGGDSDNTFYGLIWEAQTFVANKDNTITDIELLLSKVGSPGTLTVGIQQTDGPGRPFPDAADYTTGTYDADNLNDTDYSYVKIKLSDYDLTEGVKYAIVVRVPAGDASNYVKWKVDESTPTYTFGSRSSSGNAGHSWVLDTTRDFMFRVYGKAIDPVGYSGASASVPLTVADVDSLVTFSFTNELIVDAGVSALENAKLRIQLRTTNGGDIDFGGGAGNEMQIDDTGIGRALLKE